jgi:hypothetical protein
VLLVPRIGADAEHPQFYTRSRLRQSRDVESVIWMPGPPAGSAASLDVCVSSSSPIRTCLATPAGTTRPKARSWPINAECGSKDGNDQLRDAVPG